MVGLYLSQLLLSVVLSILQGLFPRTYGLFEESR